MITQIICDFDSFKLLEQKEREKLLSIIFNQMTIKTQISIVEKFPMAIRFIKKPKKKVQLAAAGKDYRSLYFVDFQYLCEEALAFLTLIEE